MDKNDSSVSMLKLHSVWGANISLLTVVFCLSANDVA